MEGVDWKTIIAIAALLWGVVNSFWTRYISAQSVTKHEIEKVSEKATELDHEVTALKATVAQLPSKDFVHRIEKNQVALEGDMNVLKEQLEPIGVSVRRIEDFLITEARKR